MFAGIYETIGELIPVYATLQESIDNQITTRPSAIIRQGTDVTSNDPRLNIPGTPEKSHLDSTHPYPIEMATNPNTKNDRVPNTSAGGNNLKQNYTAIKYGK